MASTRAASESATRTLGMLREGYSLSRIATIRGIPIGTVYRQAAELLEHGAVTITDCLPVDTITQVVAAITAGGDQIPGEIPGVASEDATLVIRHVKQQEKALQQLAASPLAACLHKYAAPALIDELNVRGQEANALERRAETAEAALREAERLLPRPPEFDFQPLLVTFVEATIPAGLPVKETLETAVRYLSTDPKTAMVECRRAIEWVVRAMAKGQAARLQVAQLINSLEERLTPTTISWLRACWRVGSDGAHTMGTARQPDAEALVFLTCVVIRDLNTQGKLPILREK